VTAFSGTAVVTGASGFIGRRLCERLIGMGVRVRAVIRRPDADLGRVGAEVRVVNLGDAASVRAALADASVVFHCAANAAFGNGPQYERDNVDTMRALIAAAQSTDVALSRFVFVSSIGAVDRCSGDPCMLPLSEVDDACPTSDYGRSKLACERMLQATQLPFVIVRPTMVVGEDMRVDSHFAVFARLSLRKSLFARINWPGMMSVVHVDDLIDALIHVARSAVTQRRVYFCAGQAVGIGVFLSWASPAMRRLNIAGAVAVARPLLHRLPFKLKALLLPALTASDAALRSTGWEPLRSPREVLDQVIWRERARVDPYLDPGGMTVITGAASGLGLAVTEALAPVRRSLVLIDRDASGLNSLCERFPLARAVVVDLADRKAVERCLREDLVGHRVTELYACAGLGARGAVQSLPLSLQQRLFEVNVIARLTLGKFVAEDMGRRQFGRIVFVSSSSAFQPLPYMAAYAASNNALLSIGEAWAAELRQSGVKMLTICPGGMKTNFQRSAGVKELEGEALMPPEEVVVQMLRALEAQGFSRIISARSIAMSLLARVLPRRASVLLWLRLMEKMR
jgi:nucleoside-diphosphate-sugar epimerase